MDNLITRERERGEDIRLDPHLMMAGKDWSGGGREWRENRFAS